jgi:membrane protein DedA with SNARE-associated domain
MISAFIASYGYFAVFLGTFLEGETVLVAAGFAAHQGLLEWPLVVLVAMAGSTLGDQLAFFLGRWKGEAVIDRFPALARHKKRAHDLLDRHSVVFILSVRFLYGLRIAGPVIIGSSRVSVLRFALLNVLGAALWSVLISGAGYAFGAAITRFMTDLKRIEHILLAGIVLSGLGFWLWRYVREKKKSRTAEK